MNFPSLKLTNFGKDAILQAVYAGAEIVFTCAKLGSGTAPSDISDMTDVVAPEISVALSGCTVANQLATLTFTFTNSSILSGFEMRELGIMANIGGDDTLFAYCNSGDDAIYIRPYAADTLVTMPFTVAVAVGNATTVTAVVSQAAGYVTIGDFDAHIHDYNNPHHVTKADIGLGNVPNLSPSNMTVSFSQASALTKPVSGSKLSVLMGLLSKAIDTLLSHILTNNNPHNVSINQIGAAAANHTHSADDITFGALPVSRGGTGGTTQAELKRLAANNSIYTDSAILATGWNASRKTYSFEADYPAVRYALDISLSPGATDAERDAFMAAIITGSSSSNVVKALGAVPEIDIPIFIKVTEVL